MRGAVAMVRSPESPARGLDAMALPKDGSGHSGWLQGQGGWPG